MQVQTLDGHTVKWSPSGSDRIVSKLQSRAADVIREVIPGVLILFEVSIPIGKKKKLWVDMFLPTHKLGIEVNGIQHSKKIRHFHTRSQFNRQKENDDLKQQFFELNSMRFVVLDYDEGEITWIQRIRKALGLE